MGSIADAPARADLERFRLRHTVERFAAEGELETVTKAVDLIEVGSYLDGNAKAVLFRAAGPEKAELVGNVMGSRRRLALSMGVADLLGKSAGDALKENVATLEQEMLQIPASARYSLDGTMAELNLDQVNLEKLGEDYAPEPLHLKRYQPFSIYPFALRDIAVWTPEGTMESEVSTAVIEAAGEHLARIDLFDRFEKEGRVSYAFRLVFESMDRTLSDADLDPAMARVTEALNAKEGWEVR